MQEDLRAPFIDEYGDDTLEYLSPKKQEKLELLASQYGDTLEKIKLVFQVLGNRNGKLYMVDGCDHHFSKELNKDLCIKLSKVFNELSRIVD